MRFIPFVTGITIVLDYIIWGYERAMKVLYAYIERNVERNVDCVAMWTGAWLGHAG